jgi:hypothetical protein
MGADVGVPDPGGIDETSYDEAGAKALPFTGAKLGDELSDRAAADAGCRFDRASHQLLPARALEVESGMIGLARFGDLGIEELDLPPP